MQRNILCGILLVLLVSCNSPPLYEMRAREFLQKHNVDSAVILKLEERKPLESSTLDMLVKFENIAVLHLVANNPGATDELLQQLARHYNEEVRWGVAYNPTARLEIIAALRTVGHYSTMNEYLARNPQLPATTLQEMYRNHEASKVSFAMNPKCPEELMLDILEHGSELDRTWLAGNASLPRTLYDRLKQDPSENVRRFLQHNPRYRSSNALRNK